MPDLISWLLWACIACGPVALVTSLVYRWRAINEHQELRNLLAAAIAQRDGALERMDDMEATLIRRSAVDALPATHPQRRRRK
jgi:hypothetical protein